MASRKALGKRSAGNPKGRQSSAPSGNGSPVRIVVFNFTKADLAFLPPKDRRLVILGGHALNMLGMWVKLLVATTNHRGTDGRLDQFSTAQTHIMIRALCGTLVEVWNWINTADVSGAARGRYATELPKPAADAYGRLGKHFGSGTFIRARNDFVFHFPDHKAIDTAFEAVSDDEDLSWFLASENTNSLYYGSEVVVNCGLYGLTAGRIDGRAGMERLVPDLSGPPMT